MQNAQLSKIDFVFLELYFVILAAHCITESGRSVIPARLLVALGKYNLLGSDIGSQELTVH